MGDSPTRHDCAVVRGEATFCSGYAPGHNLHWIQAKLARQTSWLWRDVVVDSVHDHELVLIDLDASWRFRVWTHHDLTGLVTAGEWVSLHPTYSMLALAERQISVQVVSSLPR